MFPELKKENMTTAEEFYAVIKIIENNPTLGTNDLIWLSAVREYNLPSSDVLVLIESVRKKVQTKLPKD